MVLPSAHNTRADAEIALRSYHLDQVIPRDAFIAVSANLRQQFWPVGADISNVEVARAPIEADMPIEKPAPLILAEPVEPIGETPAEAQRSERALNHEAK